MRIIRTSYLDIPGLGQKIKELRSKDTRKLYEIAAIAEISTQHWYNIENEVVNVPEETLIRVQKSLGVNLGIEFD